MLVDLMLHHPQALPALLRGTPTSVWLLLAGLVGWGLMQCRPRALGLARSVAMPLGMAVLGAWGVLSIAHLPSGPWLALCLWLAMAGATAALLLHWRPETPAGTRYDGPTRRFDVPGSGAPLLLILGLFGLKYAIGLETALEPAHAAQAGFVLPVAALYGIGNGCVLYRALRMWRLAYHLQQSQPSGARPIPLSSSVHGDSHA